MNIFPICKYFHEYYFIDIFFLIMNIIYTWTVKILFFFSEYPFLLWKWPIFFFKYFFFFWIFFQLFVKNLQILIISRILLIFLSSSFFLNFILQIVPILVCQDVGSANRFILLFLFARKKYIWWTLRCNICPFPSPHLRSI